jgi:alpha-mannosidase
MMIVYGVGDGGGGPSETIVERNLRTENVPYLPKVKLGSAQGYFDSLQPETLPLYSGEMYLEKHRGTYTSQSNNKNYNREFEEKMLSLEMFLCASGKTGDTKAMDDMWKEALLYQFHDILPGSSIARVYEETDVAYARLRNQLDAMAEALGVSFAADKSRKLLNPQGHKVCKLVKAGEGYLLYEGSRNAIAPVSYETASVCDGADTVETDHYIIHIDKDGSFASICLKNGQVIAENANKLRVFIDTGDAWDFEDDYREQSELYMQLQSSRVRNFGDLTEIVQAYTFRNSKLVQTLTFHKHLPYVGISHDVAWKDTGYMLRAEFAPKVWDSVVHSDIQFGYLDRPTTDNDAHEKAQFEMCCQKWFDISEENAGFAVLNNAKNGFMAKQGIISLNLLRSTDYPCVAGDQRPSHYSYALYPHAGGFDPVKVDDLAEQFGSRPLYGAESGQMPAFDSEQVQVTAFKPAYDGNGFILHAFERTGKAVETAMQIPTGFRLVGEVDLLEDPVEDCGEKVSFKPFQIRAFRLKKN